MILQPRHTLLNESIKLLLQALLAPLRRIALPRASSSALQPPHFEEHLILRLLYWKLCGGVFGADSGAAFEGHVLEEVGNTCLAIFLVECPDLKPKCSGVSDVRLVDTAHNGSPSHKRGGHTL